MTTTDGHVPAEAAGDRLTDGLVQTSFLVMAELSRIAAENDLSLTQLRVLGILHDRRVKMSDLAGYLGLDKSTMTGLVERARSRGLLERVRHPTDGRSVEVLLTPSGRELAESIHSRASRSLSELTAVVSAAERRRLAKLLDQILDAVEPRRSDSGLAEE